ncbi:hypothetical protein FB565_002964 [Actinoplanes lutulentus]|uniref:hypothetical protein n=1 Tax=Actinoplanes lutulentus TaxID=1287878 RepID=UPI0011B93BE1|nr:hypothetical protein [Actinoplanes lutulentus]MBB2943251.1 hypothetical protein [Actinoplanes lutulentus]
MNIERSANADAATSLYVVVLRATSAARFWPEEGCETTVHEPKLAPHGVRIRIFTRWVDEGGTGVPRELIVEVRGRAASLDDAIDSFSRIARPVATIVGFAANVRVGALEVHLAYDATPTQQSREFAEVFIPDERGPVSEGQRVRPHLLEALWKAIFAETPDGARITRALRHYELALRNWHIGGEWLALNHLWIASENLTKAVVRKTAEARGITEEELARSFQLVTNDPSRPRWKDLLGARVRQEIIFAGDTDTYQLAKNASDGIEHGIWEINKITSNALKCADKTFRYIRLSLTDLLALDQQTADELMTIELRDVQSTRTIMRGRLVGDAADPAPEGQLYPSLEWHAGVGSITRNGTTIAVHRKDRFTVRARPGVGFQPERLEVRGRLQHGQAVVEIAEQDVDVEHETLAPSARVLDAVMPLVDGAAATGEGIGHDEATMIAFNLFGQAVAYFKSITVLLDAHQPVEALPGLHCLVILAARFEQMTDIGSPGVGVALRLVYDEIDAFASGQGVDAELVRSRRADLAAMAHQRNIVVPDVLATPETSRVYMSLGSEMQMAHAAANAAYSTATWHVQRVDDEHRRFRVAVETRPLIDLVSSAAAIAMLELLEHANTLFGWSGEVAEIGGLLREARDINEVAAQALDEP